ncbi:CopG family ribbon-helix-helix protein [Thiomicrospira sp. WB1]|uniref:CopG family ribbon-helix-helix protein n=1 Tax=Thiomicrospira sp. WB1 TaxID=1685380 RepID=UPI00074696F2|nr:ribbon-helix-helix protein, CopG family [Thiomicrospira sp. WB1]KUJ72915.1 CopG family transcriptional regulator [Thiomicrospira sp. WB1]
MMQTEKNTQSLIRTSASLPAKVVEELEWLTKKRGFNNRSAILADLIHKEAAAFYQDFTNEIMAGTFTLVYDHSVPGLQQKLNQLKHRHVAEIISSTQIQLMDQHTLEVNLMQGPAQELKRISDEMQANRGIKNSNLYLTHSALPPIFTTQNNQLEQEQTHG